MLRRSRVTSMAPNPSCRSGFEAPGGVVEPGRVANFSTRRRVLPLLGEGRGEGGLSLPLKQRGTALLAATS